MQTVPIGRDEILVERVFSQQYCVQYVRNIAVFHKYRVPTARFEVGLIFFLPTLNSYGINVQQHKVAVKITIMEFNDSKLISTAQLLSPWQKESLTLFSLCFEQYTQKLQ